MSIKAGMHHLFGEHAQAVARGSVDAAMRDPEGAAVATARLLLDACESDEERRAVYAMLEATVTQFEWQGTERATGGGS